MPFVDFGEAAALELTLARHRTMLQICQRGNDFDETTLRTFYYSITTRNAGESRQSTVVGMRPIVRANFSAAYNIILRNPYDGTSHRAGGYEQGHTTYNKAHLIVHG